MKVLIDARHLSPVAFEALMASYLADKNNHPGKEGVIITGNSMPAQHKLMRNFQHTYTVGLRNQRCKLRHDPACILNSQQQLSSIFKASVAGANAKVLLDSGSAANCISLNFCKLMRLTVKPLQAADVETVSGDSAHVAGTVNVSLTIQSYRTHLCLLVIPMAANVDAILGEPWHTATKAVCQYSPEGLQSVRLYKGRNMRKLVQTTGVPERRETSKPEHKLLSHLQVKRASNKLKFFVAYVRCTDAGGK